MMAFRRPSDRTLRTLTMAGVWVLLLTLTACSGKQRRGDPMFAIDAATPEGAALQQWFAGDTNAARAAAQNVGDGPNARFARAEIAYYSGEVEAAFEDWVALLVSAPDHPVTRVAAARLYAARDEIIDFEPRVRPVFEQIDYAKLTPVTRAYVSLLHQTVEYRLWKRSDDEEPFQADRFGFAARWLKTPLISPWRLTDFDTAFEPETSDAFAAEYLSPYTAADTELNYEDIRPYWTSGITLYPNFGRSGLYYLETVANLEGDQPRDFLVYGNFVSAAKVWVDGELVFDRRENDYQTGKRYRHVRLKPGQHRILVKMGFQSGYRDWFDLAFIPTDGSPLDQSNLTFTYRCMKQRELPGCHQGALQPAGVKLLDDEVTPAALEPVFVDAGRVQKAPDIALWLTMVAGYFSGEHNGFRAAWQELSTRRPTFAAGWAMQAEEVQTLWEVPSKLRDARALQAYRKAQELDDGSLMFRTVLGRWLTSKGEEREARELLRQAKDSALDGERVRAIGALTAWAGYLDDKDWSVESEKAWRQVLRVDPSHCAAATKIQAVMYGRSDYQPPAQITPRHADCPGLNRRWVMRDETDSASRIMYARRASGRNPLRSDYARDFARELRRAGDTANADKVLDGAYARYPGSAIVASERADLAVASGDIDGALQILDDFEKAEGASAWLVWQRATLTGDLPLSSLLQDGLGAAKKAVEEGKDRALSNDEAYFVVDFAAREYFPDGSRVTLTHTVVRVMTKGAIDRYGEQSLPEGARPLLVRTIKQDGSVRVPEETAGKSTLSMPGLAEGDFVEIAYLDYDGHDMPPSAVDGVRFFFRMADISTLHSEYVVIGDVAEHIRENNAPIAQPFTYEGKPAVRFTARDNPRPRGEPRTPNVEEFLPWVQEYRWGYTIDDIEVFRRNIRESINDSLKHGVAFDDAFQKWQQALSGDVGSQAWLQSLFYAISPLVPEPSISARSFNTDVNHVIQLKDGNTMLVLKAVLDRMQVPNDIYIVKSKYQVPDAHPIREGRKYGAALLRVQTIDAGAVWLVPQGPDAMFNAVGAHLVGQPAVCVTCDDPKRIKVDGDIRESAQTIAAVARVDAAGDLSGRVTFEFDGNAGAGIRSGLRSRTDEVSRSKFADAMANGVFTGASATGYDIQGEATPHEPLRIVVEFNRPGFAREVTPGSFQIETYLFRDAIASSIGGLSDRVTPLFVNINLKNRYSLDLTFDGWSTVQPASAGERTFASRFGSAKRTTAIKDNRLTIDATVDMEIQRVQTTEYADFMKWALSVEQSANLLVRMKR